MMKDLTPELRGRKQAAWGVYKSIKDVVKKTKKTRLSAHLFNTTVLPALTYASETWALRKQDENAVSVIERFDREGGDGGLDVLNTLDGLVVKQRVEMIEVLTTIDTNNKYDVYAPAGGLLFYAYEQSNCLVRLCAGRRRPFTMHIVDSNGQEFITVRRRCKCCFCLNDNETKLFACCCCCREAIRVESPPGNEIGRVYQTCGTMLRFDICDSSGRIARIVGPSFLGMGCCTCCFPNKVFKIYADDGTEIGTITKKFGGFFKELLTNADVFHVEFPVDLSVEGKSLLLSTVFLIDFVAFEENPKDEVIRGGLT
ncbi:hypothetical protein Y032_0178g638 [Ancylostoma ceylanicum]|nr:hypothetical protein Y032_0178g638 [Ancylostoma ceylanicum]